MRGACGLLPVIGGIIFYASGRACTWGYVRRRRVFDYYGSFSGLASFPGFSGGGG